MDGLARSGLRRFAALALFMAALLFIPAGTLRYWQAWAYLAVFFGAGGLLSVYLFRHDRALLERRLSGGPFAEKEPAQKIIMTFTSLGFMEEPNVERCLEELAQHKEIDLPTDPRSWVVHVSHEHLLPAARLGLLKRLRLRLFLFLRLLSRPAFYHYGLGDEVQLSAEIVPVRVR